MVKVHTRIKRKARPPYGKSGRTRTTRSKTFSTKEAAKAYAKEQGIEKYDLVDLHAASSKRNKIRVVAQ